MSAKDVTPGKQCCYIYRQGKNKGNKCSYFVSKKDLKNTMCSQHYYRFGGDNSETPEEKSLPITVVEEIVDLAVEEKKRVAEEQERLFEERFLKEREFQRQEAEYRAWRIKRLIR